MLVYRSLVAATIFVGALLVGCSKPDQPTDLRTDGPPNVTSVLVMSDLRTGVDPDFPAGPFDLSRLIESATYCRVGDDKRPGHVGLPTLRTTQVCPEDLSKPAETDGTAEGAPPNWYARVVFDQLLDPSVEELIPQLDANMKPTGVMLGSFLNTKPVTLRCNGVDVPYNGYYVPNGNDIAWPPGPSLFVQPISAVSVPAGASCEIALGDNVKNKRGQLVAVPKSFTFKIAPMRLRFSLPDPTDEGAMDGTLEQPADLPVLFYFTAAIGAVTATDVQIFAGPNLAGGAPNTAVCNGGGTAVVAAVTPDGTTAATTALILDVGTAPDSIWELDTTYRLQFGPTASVPVKQGGAAGTFPAGFKLCFHTPAM
jgi:hypothetical protein